MRASLIVAMASAVWAQSAPGPASVTGTITHAITGVPIARAHVSLRGAKNYGALTNAQGSFSITGIAPGAYEATAERVGFFLPRGAQVVLRATEEKKDLDVRLAPLGSISGRVLDANGEPVESARVNIDTGQGFSPEVYDSTDDKGEFRLAGLKPGRYRVLASKPKVIPGPPEIRSDGTVEVRYLPTYSPGVAEYRLASRIEVKTGADVVGIEIRLVPTPMTRISGAVIGFPGAAAESSVMFSQTAGRRNGGRIGKDGTFEAWNIDPGKYFVTAAWSGPGAFTQTAPVELEVGLAHMDHLELRLAPNSDLTGQLVFEDEAARPPGGKGKVELRSVDPGMYSKPVSSDIGESGVFQLVGVGAARYRVMLSWASAYVKSVALGPNQMDGNVLNLRSGTGGAPLTVTVGSAFGSISGKVADIEGAAPGARVALVRDDFVSLGDVTFVSADATGLYRIDKVRPGGYRLAAVEEYDNGPRAGNLIDYEDILERVEVKPKDQLTRDLKRHAPVK